MTSAARSSSDSTPPEGDPLRAVRDAAYIGIGLSVIVFQKAQVQRRALEKQLRGGSGRS